ncbi:tumor necrosis factor ligand superfamily member 10-like [Aplochiton taeniatus]
MGVWKGGFQIGQMPTSRMKQLSFIMSYKVRGQVLTEDLRCLKLLDTLERHLEAPPGPHEEGHHHHPQTGRVPEDLMLLYGDTCFRLAQDLRAYITKVTEKMVLKHLNGMSGPRHQPKTKAAPRPSAHLTLRDSGLQGTVSFTPQKDLHQSCRYPVRSWGNQSFGSHLHNMSVSQGRLRIPRPGRYHLYAQVYFRYAAHPPEHRASASHQLVLCVHKKTWYVRPIQLLKAVATKGWSPDGEYGLTSLSQAGLFELRTGDEIFVSVSSPNDIHPEDSSNYFGASRYDL